MKLPVPAGHPIESVAEFVTHVMNWIRHGQAPIAFRGQSYHGWRTLPKIFRPEIGIYDHEKNAVRDLISIHPQEFRDDRTMFDQLVRMQHFNLPTRLLDVTTNPLVALYFAASDHEEDGTNQHGKVQALFLPANRHRYYDSDRVSLMSNLANLTADEKMELSKADRLTKSEFNKHPIVERLLWFLRVEKPHFEPKIVPSDLRLPVYVKPKMSNRRIIAQSGAFVLYGARRLRPSDIDDDLKIHRVLISADKKAEIRSQLEKLGIHASSLFPEIDKAADLIVRRYADTL